MADLGLCKQTVESHVDAVLRDCHLVKRLVEAMAKVSGNQRG